MNSIKQRHIEVVKELVKNPEDITSEFSIFKASILHPALGIIGEVFEIKKAVENDDSENILEEAGDLMFYITDFKTRTGFPIEMNKRIEENGADNAIDLMLEACGDLIDKVKKIVIYDNIPILLQTLYDEVEKIEIGLIEIIGLEGLTIDDVLHFNSQKLKDGPNARYPDGYSNSASKERRDKSE